MTCIVGVVKNGVVYMGGDSASASGWDISVSLHRKVFFRELHEGEKMLVGFTTSWRMGQLLQYTPLATFPAPDSDVMGWLVTRYVEALRATFKDAGYSKIESNQEEGGQFLVGLRGRLFTIHSDFQVAEYADNFAAVGCGAPYALGALWARVGTVHPSDAVILALNTADHFSNGVCGPMYVLKIP